MPKPGYGMVSAYRRRMTVILPTISEDFQTARPFELETARDALDVTHRGRLYIARPVV
jgi:hypothetical protein